jgi:hypothetical protein
MLAVMAGVVAVDTSQAQAASTLVKNTCWVTGKLIRVNVSSYWVNLYCGQERKAYSINSDRPFRVRYPGGFEVCYWPSTRGYNIENKTLVNAWTVYGC